ncbi:unnamed protein product [Effrenium voratum]|uniref:Calponin-homology (CH) domain-containing protein n=1 Tax=Effrenium voratum TaxID=2562239 RepID=A0AA36N451_9DINO|nr:unnamed protein product [Effrenium voratum]
MEDDEAAAVDWDVKSKRSANNAADVVRWIEAIVGSQKDEDVTVGEWLKSGVVLCNLVNAIRPGLIRTVNQQTVPFKQMENITKFLNAARELGLPESSMFDTPDLYEEKNLDSVITCIYALGGAVQTMCPDFGGPKLGIPLIAKGKDAAKPKSKTAPHLLHLDPEQVDIPHWASQVRQCGLDLEEAARPIVSVPLGQRLLDLVQVLQDTEEGLRGLRGAPLREELEELRRAFARHLEEGEQREAALQQELEMLRKMVPESPNSVL